MANQGLVDATDVDVTKEGTRVPLSEVLEKKADLDEEGKVPSSMLPSYVDDVLEFASVNAFPSIGEAGKIYVALDTNQTYRWSGTTYVEISKSLALGETSSTAYAGNKGKQNADDIAQAKQDINNAQQDIADVQDATIEILNILNDKISDAPSDDEQYVRKNGAWAKVDIKTSADGISFDDTEAGLGADNVQEAIEQIVEEGSNYVRHADTTGTEEELPGLDESIVQIVSKQNEKIDAAMNDIETKYQQFIEAAGGVDSLNRARLIQGIIGIDNAPVFDNAKHYKQDDIVLYRRHVYTFTHEHIGDWDENDVVMTDLFGMYFQARGTMANGEALIVQLTSDTGELNVSGKQVTIAFSDGTAPLTGTTDETGKVAFVIPFGKRYGIVAQAVNDYFPEKKIYVANNYTREVDIRYSYFRFGVYAYFDDGNKMYYDEWVSNGMPSTNEWGGKLVCAAYFDEEDSWGTIGVGDRESSVSVPSPYYTSVNYNDVIGMKIDDVVEQNEKYSKTNSSPFKWAYDYTLTINNEIKHGVIGCVKQNRAYMNNREKINMVLQSIGRSTNEQNVSSRLVPFARNSSTVFAMEGSVVNSILGVNDWRVCYYVFFKL